jgi:hypothetical protein
MYVVSSVVIVGVVESVEKITNMVLLLQCWLRVKVSVLVYRATEE